MEMSRYSIKSSAGKGLIGFVTTLNIAGEFDPAWLDSNCNNRWMGAGKSYFIAFILNECNSIINLLCL